MPQDTGTLLKAVRDNSYGISLSPRDRNKAVNSLSSINTSEHIDALIKAMNDYNENDRVRECIADALGIIGNERAIPHLSTGVYSVGSLSQHCAQALVSFGAKGLELLSAVLRKQDDPQRSSHLNDLGKTKLRTNIIKGLGTTKNPMVIPLLVETLNDPDKWVAIDAIHALGDLGDSSVKDTLLDLYTSKSDPDFKKAAKQSLGKLGVNTFTPEERIAAESFLANLKALKVGLSEAEVQKLVGNGVFQTGARIVYRNQYGEFQLIISNGKLVEIPEGFGPAQLIKQMEATLSIKE